MNDYQITTALMLLGVAFHVMSIISKLRRKYPELTFRTIWGTFLNQEWDSLMVSGLCIVVLQVILFVLRQNETVLPHWFENWGMYLTAVVWGYAGQRLAYKFLQTGESILEKKAEKLNNHDHE